jgi:hypothetical protein
MQTILMAMPEASGGDTSPFAGIMVLDLATLVPEADMKAALEAEVADASVQKKIGKPLIRMLKRLHMRNCTLAAYSDGCELLLKMLGLGDGDGLRAMTTEEVGAVLLLQPTLPPAFVNKHLRRPAPIAAKVDVDVAFADEASCSRRGPMLRHAWPRGRSVVCAGMEAALMGLLGNRSGCDAGAVAELPMYYDPEQFDTMGRSLWFAKVLLEMSPHTKLDVQQAWDITPEVQKHAQPLDAAMAEGGGAGEEGGEGAEEEAEDKKDWPFDAEACGMEVGGLILRGNRCVLVRSLAKVPLWEGMCVPTLEASRSPDGPGGGGGDGGAPAAAAAAVGSGSKSGKSMAGEYKHTAVLEDGTVIDDPRPMPDGITGCSADARQLMPYAAAVRAVAALCDIEPTEVRRDCVPPLSPPRREGLTLTLTRAHRV